MPQGPQCSRESGPQICPRRLDLKVHLAIIQFMAEFKVTTAEPIWQIPLEGLGAPGSSRELIIKGIYNSRNDNHDPLRENDTTERKFRVSALLLKTLDSSILLKGNFSAADGASYLIVPANLDSVQVEINGITLEFEWNVRREISVARGDVSAATAREALVRFLGTLHPILDNLSYKAAIPAQVATTIVYDLTHEVQYMSFVAPAHPVKIEIGRQRILVEMQPVYAAYREAMNSSSPYYRLLCLYKIMEGLLGPLRTSVKRKSAELGIEFKVPKDRVPDHDNIAIGLRPYIGKPIKEFYDKFLTKSYRDALAHFSLKERKPLVLSDPEDIQRFTDVGFLTDLCARALIEHYEAAVAKIVEARDA